MTKTTGSSTSTETMSNSGTINKDIVRKFDVGLALGLGLDITHNLGINARYINSLTHTYNNHVMPGVEYNSNTNRVFQLGLNYKF
ncbi:outer membrane beta-barrel protein [Chryseobacterium wanjuense]